MRGRVTVSDTGAVTPAPTGAAPPATASAVRTPTASVPAGAVPPSGLPPGPVPNGSVTAPTAPDRAQPGQTRILTGEAVHLDVRVAGVGSRALARLIDAVLQVVVLYGLLIVVGIVAFLGRFDDALIQACIIAILIVVLVGYPVLMETLTRGRTIGKLILGLRVVRDDGGPVTFRQALARTLVALAVEWPGLLLAPLTWLATIGIMIASPQSKRLGDHAAGTIVIHERTPTAWGWVPAMPPALAAWAATLDLTGLDDDLALAVRSFLARNRRLREPARSTLGERLVREVAAVTNPPPPPGTPAWMYLAAVHAERHRRAMLNLATVRARAAMVWPELAAALAPPRPPVALPGLSAPVVAPPPGAPVVRPSVPPWPDGR